MKQPDIRVLDLAIEYMKLGASSFSCVAIEYAVHHVFIGKNIRALERLTRKYQRQYELVTLKNNDQCHPNWWNKYSSVYWTYSTRQRMRAHRVAALKRFRKACIDAAKLQ